MSKNLKIKDLFDYLPAKLSPLLGKIENLEDLFAVFKNLEIFFKQNLKPEIKGIKVGEVYLDNNVFIDKGTVIEHGAMIKGPCHIGKNCEIRAGAYLRGNVFVDDNCVIGHSAEIKNSIILKNTHLAHFNYVGDSLLGQNVNLAGGTILANLRFDKNPIQIQEIKTGLKKLGAILGDNTQLGCNTVLNPGTVFKKDTIYSGKPLKPGIYGQEEIKKVGC
jgi:NDP-sugar pyrophosphorylase family protein